MVKEEKDLDGSVASLILWRCSYFVRPRRVEQLTKMSTPLVGSDTQDRNKFLC
jgi:hypothetical protein